MVVIKPKSTFDSSNTAPEGRHTFVFNGDIKPCSNGSLMFVCEYENDPSARVFIFGGYNNLNNMEALMGIIYCSGVGDKIRKKKPSLPDPKDGWDESTLKNDALIEQLKVDIVGCRMDMMIRHEPNTWTDEQGVKRENKKAKCQEMFVCENNAKGTVESESTTQEF